MGEAKRRRKVRTVGFSSLDGIVAMLCDKSRLNDCAVIGPLVWYPAPKEMKAKPNGRVWCVHVAASHDTPAGPTFHCDGVYVGIVDEITKEEAEATRLELKDKLAARFASVEVFDSELEDARFCAQHWPGEKIERLLAAVTEEEEQKARANRAAAFAKYAMQQPMIPDNVPFDVEAFRGRVVHMVVAHDDGCPAIGTGIGCTCNPTVTRHLQPKSETVSDA